MAGKSQATRDYTRYLRGLRYAESRGSKDPYKASGKAGEQGAYQLKPVFYQDVQRVYPQEWAQIPYEHMLSLPELQDRAATSGLRMLREHYQVPTDEDMYSAYNTGIGAWKRGVRNQEYIDTVKRGMGSPLLQFFTSPQE